MTQPDPSYHPYMFGLSANPHSHLKYGEDLRRQRRAELLARSQATGMAERARERSGMVTGASGVGEFDEGGSEGEMRARVLPGG